MTDRTLPPPALPFPKAASHFPPLALWILVQLIALSLGASRAPLWARMDRPTEDVALTIMLIVQIVAAGMLAATLLSDATRAAIVIIAGFPFAFLAGALSAASNAEVMRGETFVAGWIGLLAIWTIAFPRHRGPITAVAGTISMGGVLLHYLVHEFGANVTNPTLLPGLILAASSLVDEATSSIKPFAILISGIAASLMIALIARRWKSATGYPPNIPRDC